MEGNITITVFGEGEVCSCRPEEKRQLGGRGHRVLQGLAIDKRAKKYRKNEW